MTAVFDRTAEGYYTQFGGLSPQQEECKRFAVEHLDQILHIRQRERFLHDLKVCLCGYCEADEEEPLEASAFSQFQFYKPYIELLVPFRDKFDYLMKCVAHGVCRVFEGFEERFMLTMLRVLTFRDVAPPEHPEYVLDLRQTATPRIFSEIPRSLAESQRAISDYINKRNDYVDSVRAELKALEVEQRQFEEKSRPSQMGWTPPERTLVGQPADPPAVETLKSKIELAREEERLERLRAERAEARRIEELAEQEVHSERNVVTQTPMLHMLLAVQAKDVALRQGEDAYDEL